MELPKKEFADIHDGHVTQGFTLIELILVIAIGTAIVGSAAYMAYSFMESNRYTTTQTNIGNIKAAIASYELATGELPNNLSDLWKQPQGVKNWRPFLPKEVVDGWRRKFVYKRTPDEDKPYELYSLGPKGKKGSKAERIK